MIRHPNDSAQQINVKNLSIPQLNSDVNQKYEQNESQSSEVESCKICLCEFSIVQRNNKQLITPCNCDGSMKYVHQKCLREWLNSIVQKNHEKGGETYQISCQICKLPYLYDIEHKYQCARSTQVIKKVKGQSRLLAIGLLICFLSLTGISIAGYYTFSDRITTGNNHEHTNLVFIIAVVFLGGLTLIWILVLARIYLLKRIGTVKHIKNKQAKAISIPIKRDILPHTV